MATTATECVRSQVDRMLTCLKIWSAIGGKLWASDSWGCDSQTRLGVKTRDATTKMWLPCHDRRSVRRREYTHMERETWSFVSTEEKPTSILSILDLLNKNTIHDAHLKLLLFWKQRIKRRWRYSLCISLWHLSTERTSVILGMTMYKYRWAGLQKRNRRTSFALFLPVA